MAKVYQMFKTMWQQRGYGDRGWVETTPDDDPNNSSEDDTPIIDVDIDVDVDVNL